MEVDMMKCPECSKGKLFLKDAATYVYTYDIQEDGKIKWRDDNGYQSYLFIDREQKDFKQYVQCDSCGQIFNHMVESTEDMDMVILKKAVHSQGEISNKFMV